MLISGSTNKRSTEKIWEKSRCLISKPKYDTVHLVEVAEKEEISVTPADGSHTTVSFCSKQRSSTIPSGFSHGNRATRETAETGSAAAVPLLAAFSYSL